MTIKKIKKQAFSGGYIFPALNIFDQSFADDEKTLEEWVYKSLGEYLRLCENVRNCHTKETVAISPECDKSGTMMGYSEFTCTVAEILKDKDEIEVSVKYGNTPDKTFIRLNACQLCDYLKENYEKAGEEITVNQTAVLAMLTALEDTEKRSYTEWFWRAFQPCVLHYHKIFTDAHTLKDEPKITKKEAWERLNSEVIYNGMYSVKGYVFPDEQKLGGLIRLTVSGSERQKSVRLLHNTLKIVADTTL